MRSSFTSERCLVGVLALAALVFPVATPAQGRGVPLEQRVDRLERLMGSTALMELLEGVQGLQSEVRELRGQLEQQNHSVEQLKQRQRELYLDLDRRLRAIEATGGSPTVASRAQVPQSAVAPAPSGAASPLTTPPPSPAALEKEQAAYQRAFNLLKEGRYEQATNAFTAFLEAFPNGQYADNAQYWLGEAYYVTRQFEPALKKFELLVDKYPSSAKLAHAQLKIGYIYDELGESAKAREILSALSAQHPKTTAARLARERLQQMKAKGQ